MIDRDPIHMYQCRVLQNLDQFRIRDRSENSPGLMRSLLDMFLLWQVIQFFTPRSFLEIGFAAGQTMGIIYESSQRMAQYVSVDKNYRNRWIFDSVFDSHTVDFHETNSADLDMDSGHKFDFIHIDGDHSYEMVCNDLRKVWPLAHHQTILYMDDYLMSGVDQAIKDEILGNSDFRPFLCGNQSVFFHHMSQSKDLFLDRDLPEKSRNFVYYKNEYLYNSLVLKASMPNIFEEHPQIFIDSLKAYDL